MKVLVLDFPTLMEPPFGLHINLSGFTALRKLSVPEAFLISKFSDKLQDRLPAQLEELQLKYPRPFKVTFTRWLLLGRCLERVVELATASPSVLPSLRLVVGWHVNARLRFSRNQARQIRAGFENRKAKFVICYADSLETTLVNGQDH